MKPYISSSNLYPTYREAVLNYPKDSNMYLKKVVVEDLGKKITGFAFFSSKHDSDVINNFANVVDIAYFDASDRVDERELECFVNDYNQKNCNAKYRLYLRKAMVKHDTIQWIKIISVDEFNFGKWDSDKKYYRKDYGVSLRGYGVFK